MQNLKQRREKAERSARADRPRATRRSRGEGEVCARLPLFSEHQPTQTSHSAH